MILLYELLGYMKSCKWDCYDAKRELKLQQSQRDHIWTQPERNLYIPQKLSVYVHVGLHDILMQDARRVSNRRNVYTDCSAAVTRCSLPMTVFWRISRRHSVFAKKTGVDEEQIITSKTLPHSKCHIISLVDVVGFNFYNWCDSRTDDRTCLIRAILGETAVAWLLQSQLQLPSIVSIAWCKHRVIDLTKADVVSVLHLSSRTLSCLHVT